MFLSSVMSMIFTLKSRSSVLSTDFISPIQLEPGVTYGLALIGFYSYNTIPNIEENTYFHLNEKNNNSVESILIPVGTYEITDIESYIKKHLKSHSEKFFLKPNNNTLKCEIFHPNYFIDFTLNNSIGSLLGFSKRLLEPKITHESDLPVNIIKVRTIRIDTNLTEGAYSNGKQSHTIYEFSINSEPGFSIDETPRNPVYLPVYKRSISNITLNVLDQDSNPVNFRGEEIIIRLELKKWS